MRRFVVLTCIYHVYQEKAIEIHRDRKHSHKTWLDYFTQYLRVSNIGESKSQYSLIEVDPLSLNLKNAS